MTIVTTELDGQQLLAEVAFVAGWLRREGIGQTTVRHGTFDEWKVSTDDLPERLGRGFDFPGFRRGPDKRSVPVIFPNLCRLGAFDLEIDTGHLGARVEFCHESHVHVTAANDAVAAMFRSRWEALGYI